MKSLRKLGMCLREFCSKNKDTISALAFILGLVGLGVTIGQINKTYLILQATNAYAIQKDARELVTDLQKDEAFQQYVLENDPNKQYPRDTVVAAQRDIGRLLNFYLSVYRQFKAGGISELFGNSFASDFCQLMKKPTIEEYWNAQLKENPEHAELRHAWCP